MAFINQQIREKYRMYSDGKATEKLIIRILGEPHMTHDERLALGRLADQINEYGLKEIVKKLSN